MDFFQKHNETVLKQKHFNFLIDLCLSNLRNRDKDLLYEDYKVRGHFKEAFLKKFNPDIVQCLSNFQKYHNVSDEDTYIFNVHSLDGPKYSKEVDALRFILEAHSLFILLSKKSNQSFQRQKINGYAHQRGLKDDEVEKITSQINNLLSRPVPIDGDITNVDFSKFFEEILNKN